MAFVTSIKNLDDPRISIYRSLKGKQLDKDGVFIAEGNKVFRALLKSDLKIVSALMTEKWLQVFRRQINKRTKKGMRVYIMDRKEIERVVGFNLHQGLMAATRIPSKLSLKQAWRLWNSPHLLLAIEGIKDAENIGLIVRNSVAFGVDTIIVDKSSCNPYLRRVVRVSIGTIFKLPVLYTDDLPTALKWLKENFGTRIIAASPDTRNEILSKTDLAGNICLVFGSEDYGLSDNVLKLADSIVRIPISPRLDSLNVSSANAIFLHHAISKRRLS